MFTDHRNNGNGLDTIYARIRYLSSVFYKNMSTSGDVFSGIIFPLGQVDALSLLNSRATFQVKFLRWGNERPKLSFRIETYIA
jgi:hypothetical protein